MLLWLAAASGAFLMIVSCVPIANAEDYASLAFIQRGDPGYSRSQISLTIAPALVLLWAGLVTALMLITVVLPMQRRDAGPVSTSDRAFTLGAIIYMAVPMALL